MSCPGSCLDLTVNTPHLAALLHSPAVKLDDPGIHPWLTVFVDRNEVVLRLCINYVVRPKSYSIRLMFY